MADYPNRKSPRANFSDYSKGDYFITICTAGKRHYFGEISDGKMHLTDIGLYADTLLTQIHEHHPYADLITHIVMPNHIHAIIRITDDPGNLTIRTPLGVVVGGFKQTVTMYARKHGITFGWHTRYHDHIIRGLTDGRKIAQYIKENPARWDTDTLHSPK